jgi:uncharacterized repeat protein (TIGR03806 family)
MRALISVVSLACALVACSSPAPTVDGSTEAGRPTPNDVTPSDVEPPDGTSSDVVSLDATAPPASDAAMEAGSAGPSGLDERVPNRTCRAFERPVGSAGVRAERALPMQPALSNVVEVRQAPGDDAWWYFVEKVGRIRRVRNDGTGARSELFADISARVQSGPSEAGLLGLAFHPDFARNGRVFLSYTRTAAGRLQSVLSRFSVRAGGAALETDAPGSETVLLTQDQPFDNHNGGQIAFGPDGMLYLALGDGGSAGDPMNTAQNLGTLLGKLLRLDVDRADPGRPYAIPMDNPLVGRAGARGEIWAFGLRNPWKFSFDTRTGGLWTGDVGQGALEEVDLIRRGGNYGWRIMEGTRCYNPVSDCPTAGLQLPVLTYPRTDGVSITGGYVYRGSAIPSLAGRYIFGDFGSSRVWALRYDPQGRATKDELFVAAGGISTFAQDTRGEVYVVTYRDGALFRIAPSAAGPSDSVPRTLSATGCFVPGDVTRVAPGVVPYTVRAPLWSDGADKDRYFAIPDGTTITIGADGDMDFPIGTVLIKTFTLEGRRVETRLFVRHADGTWAGYTYAYNAAGTDADLLPASDARTFGARRWYYPSRAECMQCHTAAAGFSLGLELAQLNGPLTYPSTGRTANQLSTLARAGYLAAPLPGDPSTLPSLAPYDGSAPDADRARSYLHANCAPCHRPSSTGRGPLDLRYQRTVTETMACDARPSQGDLGVTDARILAPGAPERSLLALRMRALDVNRMPPLASSLVDPAGTAVIDRWIRGLARCP